MGGPHVLSPIPNLEAGEGLLVRDDRLNKSIDEAWKVLPPLYGVNGDTNNFFDRATEVRHDFFNFYRVRADLGRLKLKPDGDDGDVPAGLQVLPVKTPGKLYQLVLILVCLRRISERETMVGHGEVVADADAAASGDPCESELVAALRDELRAERDRSAKDRVEFKALLAEQYKVMTGELIKAVKAAQAQAPAP